MPVFLNVSRMDVATSGYSESFLAEWKKAIRVQLNFSKRLDTDFETKLGTIQLRLYRSFFVACKVVPEVDQINVSTSY